MVKIIVNEPEFGNGQIKIEGDVVQPLFFNARSFTELPSQFHIADVADLAEGYAGKGIWVKGLLDRARMEPGVDHVTFHSQDGRFAASLRLQDAMKYGIILYEADGQALSPSKGGPFRLVAPGLGDMCANVKSVGRIELTKGAGKDTRPSNETC